MGTAEVLALYGVGLILLWLVLSLPVIALFSVASRRKAPTNLTVVIRRCDVCNNRWRAQPEHFVTGLGLRVRRSRRRAIRRRLKNIPTWCQPQGWYRCPSCLSRRVRTTGEPRTPEPAGGKAIVVAGAVTCLAGLALLITVGIITLSG